jgi:hypothetical protein
MGLSRELLAHGQEVQQRNIIPPRIIRSWILIEPGKIKMRENPSKLRKGRLTS